jgi:hypothetical protein
MFNEEPLNRDFTCETQNKTSFLSTKNRISSETKSDMLNPKDDMVSGR